MPPAVWRVNVGYNQRMSLLSTPSTPIELQGATNFCDAGGRLTQDGRRMRSGLIYRSDDLHALNKADLKALEGLPLRQVIDLRSQAERQALPDRLPAGTAYLHLPIHLVWQDPYEARRRLLRGRERPEQIFLDMKYSYQNIVVAHRADFKTLFELLERPERLPLLIHCTGGKDRTGMSVVLIQSALGVARQDIFVDYLTLRPRRKRALRRLSRLIWLASLTRTPPSTLVPLLEPHHDYLQAFFERIEALYGSVEDYIERELGVTPTRLDALRRQLTEEAA